MAKKIKSTTPPKELTKKQNPVWALLSREAEQLFPSSNQSYDRLAYSLCNYFQKDPEAMYLKEFFIHYGIRQTYFYELVAKSPLLKEALEIAKEIIYIKRLRKLNSTDTRFLRWDLHNYSDEVRKNDEYQDERKMKVQEGQVAGGTIIIREGATANLDKELNEKK